jgi:hypothetical protein
LKARELIGFIEAYGEEKGRMIYEEYIVIPMIEIHTLMFQKYFLMNFLLN